MNEVVVRMLQPAERKPDMASMTIQAAIWPQEYQLKQVLTQAVAQRPPDMMTITQRALTGA